MTVYGEFPDATHNYLNDKYMQQKRTDGERKREIKKVWQHIYRKIVIRVYSLLFSWPKTTSDNYFILIILFTAEVNVVNNIIVLYHCVFSFWYQLKCELNVNYTINLSFIFWKLHNEYTIHFLQTTRLIYHSFYANYTLNKPFIFCRKY